MRSLSILRKFVLSFLINFFKNEFNCYINTNEQEDSKYLTPSSPKTRLSSHIVGASVMLILMKFIRGYETNLIQFNINSQFNSPTLAPSSESTSVRNALNVWKRSSADYQLHNYTSTFSSYIIIIITLLTMPFLDIVPGWI